MNKAGHSLEAYIPADLEFHTAICVTIHNEILQKITATHASSLHVSRVFTSRLPGANLAAMPQHWLVAQAIRERDEQAAEEAMRKLVILTMDDVHRPLGHHPHSESERQHGSSYSRKVL